MENDAPVRLPRAVVILVLFLATALRLVWGLSRPTDDGSLAALPDQVEYLTLARHLLGHQGLWFVDARFADTVYAFRMPGYPLFLAGCGGNVRAARIVQSLLDASTCLAVYLLARRLLNERVRARDSDAVGSASADAMPLERSSPQSTIPSAKADPTPAMSAVCIAIASNRLHSRSNSIALAALAIVAVNPLLIYFSGLILSETLFVALLTWGMLLLVLGFGDGKRPGRPAVWLAGGILLAADVLVRPSAGALPILLGVGALFANCPARSAYHLPCPKPLGWWPLPLGFTMLALVALVLFPWALRNRNVMHQWIWTDTNSGITLYDGYNPDATGASDQSFIHRLPQLQSMNEVGRSAYLSHRAMEFILDHPQRAAELALAKLARTWSPAPLSDQFGRPFYRAILLAYAIPLDLLALAGLFVGTAPRGVRRLLLLPAIYFSLVHALTIGSLRYRLPAEPALAILAAMGIAALLGGARSQDRQS